MGPRLKDVEDDREVSISDGFGGASMGPRLKDVEDLFGSHVTNIGN